MELKNKYFNKIERTVGFCKRNIIILKLNDKIVAKGDTLKKLLDDLKIKNHEHINDDANSDNIENMITITYATSLPDESDSKKSTSFKSDSELTDDFLYEFFYKIEKSLSPEPINFD